MFRLIAESLMYLAAPWEALEPLKGLTCQHDYVEFGNGISIKEAKKRLGKARIEYWDIHTENGKIGKVAVKQEDVQRAYWILGGR